VAQHVAEQQRVQPEGLFEARDRPGSGTTPGMFAPVARAASCKKRPAAARTSFSSWRPAVARSQAAVAAGLCPTPPVSSIKARSAGVWSASQE
jgi:hypothetical protein